MRYATEPDATTDNSLGRTHLDDIEREKWAEAKYQQALNDARACRESRRVSRRLNTCTCYCCKLDRQAYGRDW